jgi:hypothetical protein
VFEPLKARERKIKFVQIPKINFYAEFFMDFIMWVVFFFSRKEQDKYVRNFYWKNFYFIFWVFGFCFELCMSGKILCNFVLGEGRKGLCAT